MRRFYKMFLYDMKMTLREREAMFWMFMFPVLLMIILGLVFGRSGQVKLKIGVVDLDGSPVSQAIVEAFSGIDALVVEVGEEEAERAELKEGNRNAILIIPEGFGRELLSGRPGEVAMIVNKTEPTTAQITTGTLSGIVDKISQRISGAPQMVTVNEEEAQGVKDFEYIDFMVPGIIAVVILFSGISGYALEIATYREKGILRRIKVSPLSIPTFLASGITTVLIFVLAQAAVLLILGVLAFRLKVSGNYLYMAVVVIVGALSFLSLGFLISSLTKNSRSAALAANALAMPMMFLSGLFFSVEWVPTPLKVIARCLPLYYLGDALREVMINSASLAAVWVDMAVLLGVGAVAFLASARFFRWE